MIQTFENLNFKFFIILIIIAAISRNFRPVYTEENTPTPVDVEVVDEFTTLTPATAPTSVHVIDDEANSTSTASTVAYVCSNSFEIHSKRDFNEKVLNSTKPIIVQFYAPWSELCGTITPRIGKAIDERGGKIKLARINIDEHEKIGLDFGVQLVPCIVAFRAGEVIEKLAGLQEENYLKIFIGKYIIPDA